MSLLSTAELTQLQADFVAAACDKVCQVYHKSTTSGSSGEPVPTYTLSATTVAGMTQPGSAGSSICPPGAMFAHQPNLLNLAAKYRTKQRVTTLSFTRSDLNGSGAANVGLGPTAIDYMAKG